ncbi:MAG: hypothetical protein J6P87_02400 [Lachnospiraceae bacterium]|nr:hypothetical protein [Lachnospiraceae bacterium]
MKKDRAGLLTRRNIFILIAAAGFAAVLAFNLLTPMISDDYAYGFRVRQAASFADLLRQEYEQYQTWTGRSVAHLILRIFLSGSRQVFAVCNSLVFTLLSFLIYRRVKNRDTYDIPVYLLILTGLWIFGVEFAQTCLWETGSCNYLWTTTIIMLFIDRMEAAGSPDRASAAGRGTKKILPVIAAAAGMFLLGTAAGWCNENTSGGALLFCLMLLFLPALFSSEKDTSGIRKPNLAPAAVAGAAGCAFGLFMMVRAPGNYLRSSYIEENYSGFIGMLARFSKVTQIIGEKFYVLILVFIVTCVITVLQSGKNRAEINSRLRNRCIYAFLFVMTSYALILAAGAQARAYFGAGVFLITACVQGIRDCIGYEREHADGILARTLSYGALSAMLLFMFFTYIDCGMDLARIWRDASERVSILEQAQADGAEYVEVQQLHPQFDNRYTAAFSGGSELQEDPGYWINVEYESYYGIAEISALAPDEEPEQ